MKRHYCKTCGGRAAWKVGYGWVHLFAGNRMPSPTDRHNLAGTAVSEPVESGAGA